MFISVAAHERISSLFKSWIIFHFLPIDPFPYSSIYHLSICLPNYLSTHLYIFLTTISTIRTHPFIYTHTYFLLVSPNYPGILPVLLHAVLLSTSTDNSTCITAALELSSSIIIIQLFIDCYPCRLLSVPMNKLVSQLQHLLSPWLQAKII